MWSREEVWVGHNHSNTYGDYKGLNVGFLACDHLFSVLQVLLEFFFIS